MADDLRDDSTGHDPYRDDSYREDPTREDPTREDPTRDRRPSNELGALLGPDERPDNRRDAPRPPAFRDRMPPPATRPPASRPHAFRGDAAFRDDRFEDVHDRTRFGGDVALSDVLAEDDRPLADAGPRLIARVIDGLTVLLAFVPAVALSIVGAVAGGDGLADGLAFAGLVGGAITLLVVQLRLLAAEGQTLGKRAMNLRVVDLEDGLHPGFARAFWLREALNGFVWLVFPLYFVVDALFVFREDRRCIHDLLAKTVVVSEAPALTRRRA